MTVIEVTVTVAALMVTVTLEMNVVARVIVAGLAVLAGMMVRMN